MITGLFMSPDSETVAIEFDDGEGGLVIVESGYAEVAEIDVVDSAWKRVGP